MNYSKPDPYEITRPPYRWLRIFSLDPSLRISMDTVMINQVCVEIPWEETPVSSDNEWPLPGPVGEYLEVIDYDSASGCFYKPVDLNHPYILAENGLTPAEGNPQFHQQMVYAVAMRTIWSFEKALGRRIFWSHRHIKTDAIDPSKAGWEKDAEAIAKKIYVQQLRIYPHALREANAYYSPSKLALLFGYFTASSKSDEGNIPGSTVFTCLSHDIIAHETTHALLDGINPNLIEPSNPDVLAFHEAFADIVALFQHFSYESVLQHQIANTKGDISSSVLVELAQEFGKAIGREKSLRSALGTDTDEYNINSTTEPHKRGAILVAAIFDAFLLIYRRRSRDLVRIASQGSGILPAGDIHPDLVNRLSREAAKSAMHVLNICIRAMDYMPPLDITFGDYLRALITADVDLVPDDKYNYRVAFIEAFRRRGIVPGDVRTLSEQSLCWEDASLVTGTESPWVYFGEDFKKRIREWNLTSDRQKTFIEMYIERVNVHEIFERSSAHKGRVTSGIDFTRKFWVDSVRPVRRTGPDGRLLMDVVIQVTQRMPGSYDAGYQECVGKDPKGERDFWFRGGFTLIVDNDTGRVRYCIYKDINSETRYERTRKYYMGQNTGNSLHATYFGQTDPSEKREIFALLHRLYSAEETLCQ